MMGNTVKRMIERFGSTVTYTSRSGIIDTNTLKKSATMASYVVKMQVSSFTKRMPLPGLAQDGDLEGRLAADGLEFTPQKNDNVLWDGKWFTVVSVNKMKTSDNDAVFILVLRGQG